MFDHDRFVHLSFHVDTSRINARTALLNMNQLEKWWNDGVVLLSMSRTAQEEAAAGGSSARAQKARSYIFTLTGNLVHAEPRQIDAIAQLLFPNGIADQNEQNDVEVVFNAGKYGAILVTADGASKRQPGGILGNRAGLAALGIEVMTDEQAVLLVRQKILERDMRARWRADQNGTVVPTWVGAD
jgi:hypothetical protein